MLADIINILSFASAPSNGPEGDRTDTVEIHSISNEQLGSLLSLSGNVGRGRSSDGADEYDIQLEAKSNTDGMDFDMIRIVFTKYGRAYELTFVCDADPIRMPVGKELGLEFTSGGLKEIIDDPATDRVSMHISFYARKELIGSFHAALPPVADPKLSDEKQKQTIRFCSLREAVEEAHGKTAND